LPGLFFQGRLPANPAVGADVIVIDDPVTVPVNGRLPPGQAVVQHFHKVLVGGVAINEQQGVAKGVPNAPVGVDQLPVGGSVFL